MAHRAFILCGFVVGLLVAARTEAQPLIIRPDRIALGGSIAASSNADENGGDRAPDVALHLELPLYQPFKVRLDVGRVTWRFGSDSTSGAYLLDHVTLTRSTISLIKVAAPQTTRNPLAGYVGGGIGVYHYGFDHGRPGMATRAGVHALAGIECVLPNDRVALGWELQLHAVSGPRDRLVPSSQLLVLQGSFGVKYRF